MRYLILVIKGLGRNKKRTLLTTLAITVALFLFSTIATVPTAMDQAVEAVGKSRLVTRNAISLVHPLPVSYLDRIAQVEGVELVSYGNWFGGQLKDRPESFFAQFGVEPESYMKAYSEVSVPPDQKEAFIKERTACIIGERLAQEFGWKVGDNVSLVGAIYPGDWQFTIRGIYSTTVRGFDVRSMLFHWKYLDEGQPPGWQGTVGFYIVKLKNPEDAARVAAAIDGMFENSSAQTLTETEKNFQAGFNMMMGSIKTMVTIIGFAVVFAMVLVAANTMIMAGRERTREIAVLKALGFDDGLCQRLLLAESITIALVGGLLGTVVAKILYQASGFTMGGFFPDFTVEWSTVAAGLAIAIATGLISGFVPARRAANLRIVDALRNVG